MFGTSVIKPPKMTQDEAGNQNKSILVEIENGSKLNPETEKLKTLVEAAVQLFRRSFDELTKYLSEIKGEFE